MIYQSLEALEREVNKGEFRPVYLITGHEQYLCRQAISLLKNKALTSESLAFDYAEFIAGEIPIDEILAAANTFPMVGGRKVVLVNQAERLKDSEQDFIVGTIQGLSRRSILILAADELDHRKRFYKAFRDAHCVVEFPKLKGAELEGWAEAFVRRQGYRISSSAIRKIVELAGSDLQNLSMELDKLLLYSGRSQTVPDSVVDELVQGNRQQSVFELINAVGRRDRSGALRSLSNLLSMGEHPLVVVAMMARHCRQVMIARERLAHGSPTHEIASAAQIPPFMLDQFLRQARSTDSGTIRQMFVRLADIDRRLKSSAADGRMLIEGLICALV